ncbi:hypothetical protein P170DRAFT_501612 [Aspergillus steynii IBT 23096]|uniref:BTB domain-containing protein n=1 Tax=Aspergillus steynii IBT 23096 TaxID=1392250 RepID=A0A2I2FVV3_9EURO|nr:uncharacterized protein P170DRAFT_501612 [Aspergillus steynii IBT 23096]PLB44762.1 hypothetical protein P170DRAFT_501612 [Aspergillus steynii IBT 23096]
MEAERDFSSVATDASNLLQYSIIHSSPFTFLVGANHTQLTVQSGLARHVSKPLDHLMSSGQTRESKHHIAVLEEEDVETFVAFCEYAYTGDYRVPPPGSREEEQEQKPVNNPFKGVFSEEPIALSLPPAKKHHKESRGPEHGRPSNEGLHHGEGAPHAAYPHEKFGGNTTSPEDYSTAPPDLDPTISPEEAAEQQPTTPAAEEGDPWDSNAGASATKGKKGKKGKKDKKKQNGPSTEEPTTGLTPPSTPPPEHPDIGQDPHAAETAEEQDGWGLESADPRDTADPADNAPSGMTESWEHTAPTPPEEEQDKMDRKQESKRDYEQGAETGPMIDNSFAKQHFSSHHEKGISLWDEFTAMDYIDPRAFEGTRPPSALSTQSSRSGLPYLIFHAKLYVFATRYLIPALAQLCLRKLHRDLLLLAFPDGAQTDSQDDEQTTLKARMVLDLLHYTYTKTTRLEPISPTSATQLRDNELRKLVIHYAACKVRDLARYCPPIEPTGGSPSNPPEKPSARGLRALMDTTSELASDLVYRMM